MNIANRGGYDDIDAALQFHLGAENNMNIMTLAMGSIEFRFQGTASLQPLILKKVSMLWTL